MLSALSAHKEDNDYPQPLSDIKPRFPEAANYSRNHKKTGSDRIEKNNVKLSWTVKNFIQ